MSTPSSSTSPANDDAVDPAPVDPVPVPVESVPVPVPATVATSEWGRVDADGTVFVRMADAERAVGSWQAGTPQEGLAHFARRFEVISTEVALLEQRLRSGAGDPQQVAQTATRLRGSIPTAVAVGDLGALVRRVEALLDKTADAVEAGKVAKAEARARAA